MTSHEERQVGQEIEDILDDLANVQSTSGERVALLSQLERLFGQSVLQHRSSSEGSSSSAWWTAQLRPRTCIALALISLLHRLHLLAGSTHTRPPLNINHEMTACFTILQGLSLKDEESRIICSKPSSLKLVLAIIDAEYWQKLDEDAQYITHAIDFLICVTMASRLASASFDKLDGEDVVRTLIHRHTSPSKSSSASPPAITLDDVKDNAIASKCAEFLLLLASERSEAVNHTIDILADQTSLFGEQAVLQRLLPRRERAEKRHLERGLQSKHNDALHGVAGAKARHVPSSKENVILRSRRARSMSPVKGQYVKRWRNSAEDDDGDNAARLAVNGFATIDSSMTRQARPALTGRRDASNSPSNDPPSATPFLRRIASPTKGLQRGTSPHKAGVCETPHAVPRRPHLVTKSRPLGSLEANQVATPARGGSVQREEQRKDVQRSLTLESKSVSTALDTETLPGLLNTSPTKAFMGPSPAVRRAHERSQSPDKAQAGFRSRR